METREQCKRRLQLEEDLRAFWSTTLSIQRGQPVMQQFAAQPRGAAVLPVPPQPPVPPLPPVQPAGGAGQPVRVFSTMPAQRRVQDFLDFEKRNEYQTYMHGLYALSRKT